MFLDIEHEIEFTYDDFISESWVELRIEPQTSVHQMVNLFYLAVGPRTKVFRYNDWSNNAVRHFSIAEYHQKIEVKARTIVETKPTGVLLPSLTEPIQPRAALAALRDYLTFSGPITESKPLLNLYKSINITEGMALGKQVELIGNFVHNNFEYKPNLTTYDSTIHEALEHKAGVCQDLAQIMIALLRLSGIPARYVNGYLHVINQESSSTAESHAWVEFYSTEYGWIGYDPTGNVQPGEHHCIVATGRHYDEVPPNRGVYRGQAKEQLKAIVRTKEIPAPAFSSFREEIREIELPVYSEIPDRRPTGTLEDQQDQTSQQQQQ